MKKLVIVLGIFLLTLTQNCSNNNDDGVTYDLQFELSSTEGLSEGAIQLYERIKNREPVQFDEITQLLGEQHASDFKRRQNNDPGNLIDWLKKLFQDENSEDPFAIKLAYEKSLKDSKSADTVYNFSAVSVGDIKERNRLQCFSGSLWHALSMRQKLRSSQYSALSPVMILEHGHILPGYLKQQDGKWHLTGLESTASGRGEIRYGEVNAIATRFRIVDAQLFAVIELFKYNLKDAKKLANEVLRYTANQYKLSNPFLVENTVSLERNIFNSTIFSFGIPNVPEGDVERTRIDTLERRTLPGNNPNPHIDANRTHIPTAPTELPPRAQFIRDRLERLLASPFADRARALVGSPYIALMGAVVAAANALPPGSTAGKLTFLRRQLRGGLPISPRDLHEALFTPYPAGASARHALPILYFNDPALTELEDALNELES